MANHSPHPNSLSPHSKQPTSAFQWPIPPSSPSSHLKPHAQQAMNDITIKEILERYNEDPELLKYILTAKTEEDKVPIYITRCIASSYISHSMHTEKGCKGHLAGRGGSHPAETHGSGAGS